ncbi:SHOCT domain-containing protein [Arthrobacter sp. LjRoot14]|uniref:SHOCT domain-containing protein n=1 Tax=Arthrobacter sp. LjRoot14 TaxID=3342265 RepID=UPI003ECD15BC
MMWGYGPDMGWMWLWGVLMLVGVALLVLVAVRLFSGGGRGGFTGGGFNPQGPPGPGGPWPGAGGPGQGRSRARQILDERFAKGELTADEYREQARILGEEH